MLNRREVSADKDLTHEHLGIARVEQTVSNVLWAGKRRHPFPSVPKDQAGKGSDKPGRTVDNPLSAKQSLTTSRHG
jgi:hypothetical protein